MKKLVIGTILVAGVANLTGCAGMMMDRAKTDCANIGYQPGTVAYMQCVDTKYTQSRQNFADAWTARASSGSGYQYQRPVQTTCTQTGMFLNCTTN